MVNERSVGSRDYLSNKAGGEGDRAAGMMDYEHKKAYLGKSFCGHPCGMRKHHICR